MQKKLIFPALTEQDILNLITYTPDEIPQLTSLFIERTEQLLKTIITTPAQTRTFENTAYALDQASAYQELAIFSSIITALEMVSPDDALRDACHQAIIIIEEFFVEHIGHNKEIYQAVQAYAEGAAKTEKLRPDQHYFLNETLQDFKRAGLSLPEEQLEQVKELNKELAILCLSFDKNIADDASSISVDKNALAGLEEDFIAALSQDTLGNYIVGVDYPTYFTIMEYCSIAETRKQLYHAFANRAYPINHDLLQEIIAKRDQLAQFLGFPSYSHLDLDDTMAKTPEAVHYFLDSLAQKVAAKEEREYQLLTAELPTDIQLDEKGNFYPWDIAYVKARYKKKHFNLDEREIAQYFPLEITLNRLCALYEDFLSLKFTISPLKKAWHEDLLLIQVHQKETKTFLGSIILDLYPRPNKFSHACQSTLVPAVRTNSGKHNPALALVIANFPKPTADKPSLLKFDDVLTFFHEFGHAMHALFGATYLASHSGTDVKLDFAEMPSQMFEEWLWEKEILQQVSCHYQTQQPLPEYVLDQLLNIKNFDSGYWVQRQIFLSLLSLTYFMPGVDKKPDELLHTLTRQLRNHIADDSSNHMYASFGHLTDYGAGYYSYLWSKVYALDLFETIRKQGLRNPRIGQHYISSILSPGASIEPAILLHNFLGREPEDYAFIKSLGL